MNKEKVRTAQNQIERNLNNILRILKGLEEKELKTLIENSSNLSVKKVLTELTKIHLRE